MKDLSYDLSDVIATHGRFRPNGIALVDDTEHFSWSAVCTAIDQAALSLIECGLEAGGAVAMIVGNDPAAIIATFAVLRAGGVCVPLSPLMNPEALALMIQDCGARIVTASRKAAALAAHMASLMPALTLWNIDERSASPHEVRLRPSGNAPCTIIYSSGTTGIPKGIVHHRYSRAIIGVSLAVEFRIDRTAVVMLVTPLFTNATWAMLLPAMVAGATTVSVARFVPEEFLAVVQQQRVTHVLLVPTLIRALLDCPRLNEFDLSSLRVIICAGSKIPSSWKAEAIERFRGRLFEVYGLTEGLGTTLHPEDPAGKWETVGTPIAGTDIRIVGDDGNELPPGEIGEVVGYGAGLMVGYHNRRETTNESIWSDSSGRGFIRSGDMGRMDQDGFLSIVDRKKDMIVSGGVNVFASDIEEVFRKHPAVADVAVVARPHPKWVETPVALVIPRPGETLDPAELKRWGNALLGRVQHVDEVILRETDFPRNMLGKVMKKELRESL